jgi:predicted ATPase
MSAVGKEEKEKKRVELVIEARNFGPISRGKIALKPLTLFIGPNNSGKSYAAMLVHSIFESFTPTLSRGGPLLGWRRYLSERLDVTPFRDEIGELERQIGALGRGKEFEIPKQLVEKVTDRICAEIYEDRLGDELVRSYACPLNELVRIGERSFELTISLDSCATQLAYQEGRLRINEYPQPGVRIAVRVSNSSRPRIEVYEIGRENESLVELGGPPGEEGDTKFIAFRLMEIILAQCAYGMLQNVVMPCHYLPAARSGILQGHKALAASIIRKAPYAGIEALEIPKFSGVVSDFISSILTLPEEKGPFYQLAQDFERELIRGEIVVQALDEHKYPEIRYRFQSAEIPLHRASSTVSELAPLFLYLKYGIRPNSILIIEEPEAHLHPANQRILARLLVRLVRAGVFVTLTTHSEYLLEQLSSFILLSKVEAGKRVEWYGYGEEDFLSPAEVAAYVFQYDEKSGGHTVTEVEVTEEDGISQEEFVKVHEALYEETIELRRDLSAEARVE